MVRFKATAVPAISVGVAVRSLNQRVQQQLAGHVQLAIIVSLAFKYQHHAPRDSFVRLQVAVCDLSVWHVKQAMHAWKGILYPSHVQLAFIAPLMINTTHAHQAPINQHWQQHPVVAAYHAPLATDAMHGISVTTPSSHVYLAIIVLPPLLILRHAPPAPTIPTRMPARLTPVSRVREDSAVRVAQRTRSHVAEENSARMDRPSHHHAQQHSIARD